MTDPKGIFHCVYCTKPITKDKILQKRGVPCATRDHIVAKSQGGNICVYSCYQCNQSKQNLTIGAWLNKLLIQSNLSFQTNSDNEDYFEPAPILFILIRNALAVHNYYHTELAKRKKEKNDFIRKKLKGVNEQFDQTFTAITKFADHSKQLEIKQLISKIKNILNS